MRCIITDQAPRPHVPRRNEPALQAEVPSISCVYSIGLPDNLRPCVSLGIMCLSEHSGHRRATCSRGTSHRTGLEICLTVLKSHGSSLSKGHNQHSPSSSLLLEDILGSHSSAQIWPLADSVASLWVTRDTQILPTLRQASGASF